MKYGTLMKGTMLGRIKTCAEKKGEFLLGIVRFVCMGC